MPYELHVILSIEHLYQVPVYLLFNFLKVCVYYYKKYMIGQKWFFFEADWSESAVIDSEAKLQHQLVLI